MTPRARLCAYALAVVAVTLIHVPAILGGLLALAVLAAGGKRWLLLRRTLRAVLFFNLVASLGYAAVGLWRGDFRPDYLLLLNLRVLLLVFLGFWYARHANLLAALAGWPTLTLIATLTLGQMRSLARTIADFRLAFTSRTLRPPRLRDRAHHAGAQGIVLMDKSLAAATETALAMKSRGAFDA